MNSRNIYVDFYFKKRRNIRVLSIIHGIKNMNNYIKDEELNFKDLIFFFLRKWRFVIIFSFAISIFAGGYKAGKIFLVQRNQSYILNLKEQGQKDQVKYENEKYELEKDSKDLIARKSYLEKYRDNSILLKIDPYRKGVASADVFIKVPEEASVNSVKVTSVDYADGIVKAYVSALNTNDTLLELAKFKGMDLTYFSELIKITADYDSNMYNITVSYIDQEGASDILSELLNNVDSVIPIIEKSLGQHTVSILNQDSGVVIDQSLADYQKLSIKDLVDATQNLEVTNKALKDLKKPQGPIELSVRLSIKEVLKYGVTGFFIGTLLSIFGICLIFIKGDRLVTDRELKEKFGLRFIGALGKDNHNKFFCFIDKWLDKLEGIDKVSKELFYDIVETNINNFSQKPMSIFLTGDVEEEMLIDITSKLQERMTNAKIDCGIYTEKGVVTLQKINEFDEIVFVENCRVSRFSKIKREIEYVNDLGKRILGYIMIS